MEVRSIPRFVARSRTAGAAVAVRRSPVAGTGRASAVAGALVDAATGIAAAGGPAATETRGSMSGAAAAVGSAAAAAAGSAVSVVVSMRISGEPTDSTSPTSAPTDSTTPATGDGSSTVALSVMTSTNTWSSATVSPTLTCHSTISASAMPSPTSGSLTMYSLNCRPPSLDGRRRRRVRARGSSPTLAHAGTACPNR